MTTYIAEFKAAHKTIKIMQHSVFTWKQEGGEIDPELLQGKIKRESSVHFYNLLAAKKDNVTLEDISVEITKTAPFNG
jgi:hypothetical protein